MKSSGLLTCRVGTLLAVKKNFFTGRDQQLGEVVNTSKPKHESMS